MRTSAIVLAAGESKRMKRQKLLLPWEGKTIIEEVINHLLESKAHEILVVLGADSDRVEKKLRHLPVKITVNPLYKKGMLSSIQWGFKETGKDVQGMLICLGDQPLIPFVVIDRIIDAFDVSKKGIVIPVYKQKRGHPVLINARYRDEVDTLDANIGLRALMSMHPQDIFEVAVDTPGILKDIDDKDDYSRQLGSVLES
jgi:molybdenum cofactor cytidylyltransferase